MSWLDGVRHRIHVLLNGERYARGVERELRFHTELDALSRSTSDRQAMDAELAAQRALGNATYYKEEVRRMTLTAWVDRIRQDTSYAMRGLKRSPGFTVAVVGTLGLGIGVNASMFSLLDRIFLRPPEGVASPNDVRRLYLEFDGGGGGGRFTASSMEPPQFRALQRAVSGSIALGAFTQPDSTTLRYAGARVDVRRSRVTPDYFKVLGVRATAGRLFGVEESDIAVPTPVAVLSDALWRRVFDADRSILGKRIAMGPTEFTVVGIAPPSFRGVDIDAADIWVPLNTFDGQIGMRGLWYETFGVSLSVVARPTNPAEEERLVSAGTNAIRPVKIQYLHYDPTIRLLTGPLLEARGPGAQTSELTVATRVAGVSLMVLVIAYANVLNLVLLRATRRRREIAVRRALGVTRGRLIEQLTVESLLLASLGAIAAVLFSFWAGVALRRLVLPEVYWATGAVDARSAAFVGAIALVAGVVAGIVAAFHSMRSDLAGSLGAAMRDLSYRNSRLRSGLLVVQVALCLVLLVGAGLFIRSLDNVRSIGLGYQPKNVLVVSPGFDNPRGRDAEIGTAIPLVAARLESVAEVEAVAYTWIAPLDGASFQNVYLQGREAPSLPGDDGTSQAYVSAGFFKTTGLRLVLGRDFTSSDQAGSQQVAVISESLARLYWPGETALGKCVTLGEPTGPCRVVVGVAADARRRARIEPTAGLIYVPIAQGGKVRPRNLIVRARPGQSATVLRATESVFRPLLRDMVGLQVVTLESYVEPELRPWRLGATLFAALGALALVVAAVGVYSVVAYGVSQRTNEMGVRIALGAQARDVVELVLSEGLRVVGSGIVLGAIVALALGRLVASLLFGVVPSDASVLIAAMTLLVSVGMIACAVPGWRAAKVDPATSLRAE